MLRQRLQRSTGKGSAKAALLLQRWPRQPEMERLLLFLAVACLACLVCGVRAAELAEWIDALSSPSDRRAMAADYCASRAEASSPSARARRDGRRDSMSTPPLDLSTTASTTAP